MEAFETSGNTCWFHMSIDPEVQKTIVHQIHFLDRIRRSFQTTNWWSPIKWIASPSPTLFRSLRKWNYGFVWKWVCPNLWQPYAWQNLWWTLINHGIPFVPPSKTVGFPPPLCLSQIPERPHAVMLPHACGRCNLSWQTRRIRRAGESQRSHPPPRRSVAPRLQKCPRWGSPRESLYLRKFPMGIPRWFHGKTPFFFMIYDDLGGTPHDLGVSSISAMFITWSWSVSHWWVSVYWCLSYPSLACYMTSIDVNWELFQVAVCFLKHLENTSTSSRFGHDFIWFHQKTHDWETQKHKTSPILNFSRNRLLWTDPRTTRGFLVGFTLQLEHVRCDLKSQVTASPKNGGLDSHQNHPDRQGTHSSAVSGPKSIDKIGMPVVHSCTHTSGRNSRLDEVLSCLQTHGSIASG